MKSADYWKKRFELLEASQNKQGQECFKHIENQYKRCQRELEQSLNAWYQRLADNNIISMAEARKMLTSKELEEFKWDVNEYIMYGRENAIDQGWMKELENASSKYHISRLEAIKLQMQQSIEKLYGNQLDILDKSMRKIYKDGYMHTAYEVQRGFNVGWDFSTLNQRKIDKVINNPWAVDGSNFSQRIWRDKKKLVNELNNSLTRNIILGSDPQNAIDEISRSMNVSKSSAGRLVMTEQAYFSSVAQQDSFKDLDVEEYQILATLDSRTSKMCRNMDGKVFKLNEFEVGVTAPPFHCYCRTTRVPYFDDDFTEDEMRAARDEKGKTYYVSSYIKYNDWVKNFGANKNLIDIDLQFFANHNEFEDIIKNFNPMYDMDENIKIARKECERWKNEIKDDNRLKSLVKYTWNFDKSPKFYKRINDYIRTGNTKNDNARKFDKHIKNISYIIKKFKVEHSYVCYRGSNFNPFAGCKIGDKVEVKQFLSTTLDYRKSFEGKYNIIIISDIGVNAAYVEYVSLAPEQREMLFDKDVVYEVLYTYNNDIIVRAIKNDV